jgi:hypothetical protein
MNEYKFVFINDSHYFKLRNKFSTRSLTKLKRSLYRPRGFQISRQSAYEGGEIADPTHRPPLTPPQKILLVLISVRD